MFQIREKQWNKASLDKTAAVGEKITFLTWFVNSRSWRKIIGIKSDDDGFYQCYKKSFDFSNIRLN